MPLPRAPSPLPSADGRIMLDVRRLNALRQQRSAPATLSSQFETRRTALTRAALVRAKAGKPATHRTARRLAAFYGIAVDSLIDTRPATAMPAADDCRDSPSVERLQCRALVDAVRAAGCGRLVDVRGAGGAGKSRLLEACAADARAAGYACAILGGPAPAGSAAHSAPALLLALLGLEDAAGVAPARLAAYVRERCWTLGLALPHIDACLSLLEGARRWPLPAVHLLQTAGLCALIQLCARARPLLIAIDDLHAADWQLTMMLGVLVPATLAFPVLWVLATEQRPAPTPPARPTRLDTLARTVLHLAPPARQDAAAGADAASVHRIARTAAMQGAGSGAGSGLGRGADSAQARSMASTRSG